MSASRLLRPIILFEINPSAYFTPIIFPSIFALYTTLSKNPVLKYRFVARLTPDCGTGF